MTFSPLRPFGLVGALAVAGALLVSSPLAASAAPVGSDDSLAYVSLGDSYAAGLGQTPLTGEPAEFCQQSSQNYPHLVAEDLSLELTADVSCSGAKASNISEDEQSGGGTPPTTVPVQTSALSTDTDVVTITIGGIDAGFLELAYGCIAAGSDGPLWQFPTAPDCKSLFVQGSVDTRAELIRDDVANNVAKAYAAVRAAAPNAKVIVVGYPAIFPDDANTPADGCFSRLFVTPGSEPLANALPYTDVDVEYFHQLEVTLNEVLSDESAKAGFTFVDNLTPTLAHSACSDEPYMNAVTVDSPSALHPNAAGVAFLASQTSTAIEVAFPAPQPEPVPAGTTPKLAETGFNGGTAFMIAGGLILAAAIIFIVRGVMTKRRRAAGGE